LLYVLIYFMSLTVLHHFSLLRHLYNFYLSKKVLSNSSYLKYFMSY